MKIRVRHNLSRQSWHRVGDFVLPGEYNAWTEDPDAELPYDVELKIVIERGQARCSEFLCRRRPGGPDVTSDGIRQIPVGRLVRDSALQVAMLLEDWNEGDFSIDEDAQDFESEDFYKAYRRAGPRRRTALTDEELTKAAEVYRMALSQRQSTRKVLADVFNISESSAGRWVLEMRKRNPPLLGPAPRERQAGEATPEPKPASKSSKPTKKTARPAKKGR